jgi:hypothetical protein
MPFHCARGPFTRNEEPTLQELLEEPIVQLLTARDGVQEGEGSLISAARNNGRRISGPTEEQAWLRFNVTEQPQLGRPKYSWREAEFCRPTRTCLAGRTEGWAFFRAAGP